jgi:hypothetical protein
MATVPALQTGFQLIFGIRLSLVLEAGEESRKGKLDLDYRKTLIDMYTSQLISHGTMFVGIPIALISFLGFAVTHRPSVYQIDLLGLSVSIDLARLAVLVIVASLIGLTTYIVSRTLWYGVLLDVAMGVKPSPDDRVEEFFKGYVDPEKLKYYWLPSGNRFWNYSQLVIMRAYCKCGEPVFEGGKLAACKAFEIREPKPEPKRHFLRHLLTQPRSTRNRIIVHLVIGSLASILLLWALTG